MMTGISEASSGRKSWERFGFGKKYGRRGTRQLLGLLGYVRRYVWTCVQYYDFVPSMFVGGWLRYQC